MSLGIFAAEGPHISLSAEPVAQFGDFTLTNSMLYGVVVSMCLLAVAYYAARRAGKRPGGWLTSIFELTLEFIINMLEGIFNNRQKALQYAPIFATFFIFIVFTNLSGLLPLVGGGFSAGEGTLFRPFTADLNGTIAMSVVAILTVQVLSIKESGWLGHLKHYFTDKPFNPINLFIGILEIFGEFSRIVSLSLRLFFNTALGEVLIAILAFLGQEYGSFTLLPIYLFEILVAVVQAYIFTVLSATYLGLAINHGDHDEEHQVQHVKKMEDATAGIAG